MPAFCAYKASGMNDKKAEMERWKLQRCMYIMAFAETVLTQTSVMCGNCDAWNVPLVRLS